MKYSSPRYIAVTLVAAGFLTACETPTTGPATVDPVPNAAVATPEPVAGSLAPADTYTAANSGAFYRANAVATADGCLALARADGSADQVFAKNGFAKTQSFTGKTVYKKDNGANFGQKLIFMGREILVSGDKDPRVLCEVLLQPAYFDDGQSMVQAMGNHLVQLGQTTLDVSGTQTRGDINSARIYVGQR